MEIDSQTPTQGTGKALISLWEGRHTVEVFKLEPAPKTNGITKPASGEEADDEDEEDEEEEEVKTAIIKPERCLANVLIVPANTITVTVTIDAEAKGTLEVKGSADSVVQAHFSS